MNTRFVYKGKYTSEISFPIGGIGTGCVGLSGNGRLVDFELFNKPNKNTENGYSHFAVKAEDEHGVVDARVLNGDLSAPYMGRPGGDHFGGFGFGVSRSTLAGLPHFKSCDFTAEFPFAHLRFQDAAFPGKVTLTAFNPFIPSNDKDSSLPAGLFEIAFKNTTDKPLTYTAAFSLTNPADRITVNTQAEYGGVRLVELTNAFYEPTDPRFGHLCMATDGADAAAQCSWFRGRWFDSLGVFWQDFTQPGHLRQRVYEDCGFQQETATLTVRRRLNPGEKGTVRFVLAWYYPNCENYWNRAKCDCGDCAGGTWRNYYAGLFADAKACALYVLENYRRLRSESLLFSKALLSSTLPAAVLDAVSANLAVLKTPTCLRLTDGQFYGFEGCHCDAGCCEGSCTHVWNYAYALPFLFPALERSMRELDFTYNMDEHGGMAFRLQLPLGREKSKFRPCADGQFGGVIKVYREWKICGDKDWLASMWPFVKKCLAYAWSENNPDRWDPEKTGVLHGRQHHTLDMELFGPNSWLTGFYLAALKAAGEMGRYLRDTEAAREYEALFAKGKQWTQTHLFNGRFFFQNIDLKNTDILTPYENTDDYVNTESGEIKYQIGEGSAIDQVVAQWHANVCGLGEIFEKDKVHRALTTIYEHNFIRDMRNHANPCRVYCLNDERGTVICAWPDSGKKPVVPVPYAEETMHGFEYQAAVHMIQEGMVEQGAELIKAVRDRYDGHRRNPWNEIECGSNYARSMAAYSALQAYSGFVFDMPRRRIGFRPIVSGEFRCFWSLDGAWGIVEKNETHTTIKVLYGVLALARVHLPFMAPSAVFVGKREVAFALEDGDLVFADDVCLKANTRNNAITVRA